MRTRTTRKIARKIGRDASTGRFISVIAAKKLPAGAVVETYPVADDETYPVSPNGVRRLERHRSFRHLTDDIQRRPAGKAGRDL